MGTDHSECMNALPTSSSRMQSGSALTPVQPVVCCGTWEKEWCGGKEVSLGSGISGIETRAGHRISATPGQDKAPSLGNNSF